MQIKNLVPTERIVEDYDFILSSSQTLPVTIDRDLGDSITFLTSPLAVVIKLAAKPSLANPDVLLPEEEVTIFQAHIIAIQKRNRVVLDQTVEQKEEWKQALKAFHNNPPGYVN